MSESTESELDPRVERSRRVICEAAVAELAEVGYGAMSIESIAKRAGVGKATVYRHWHGKLDLVASAIEFSKDDMQMPADGTARDRIAFLLEWLAGYLADVQRSGVIPALVSASVLDEAVREHHHAHSAMRRQVIVELVEEGVAAGEFDLRGADPVLVVEALVGPLFYERLMTPKAFDAAQVPAIMDLVLGSA